MKDKNRKAVLEYSDEQILQTAEQLRIAYQLKKTLRYGTKRDMSVHSESVAEHLFALTFLTQYFLPLEDPERTLDIAKIYNIIIFHDFGEIVNGDVPYHIKTKEHEEQEREDAQKVFASLPELIQRPAHDSWHEYELQASPEAKFVYALDKMEPVFEMFDPINEKSMTNLKFTYEDHVGRKRKAVVNYPVMSKCLEAMTRDMVKREVFWKK